MKFIPLFKAGEVELYVPVESFISMFSSPYTPHIYGSAVDVSNSIKFGDEAPSLVKGVVEKVVEVQAPPGPFEERDCIISITPNNQRRYRVKIMHIDPMVKPGDHVDVGDVIGRYIRTNFFVYHTLPHMHIEVCKDRTLRPSSAVKIEIQLHHALPGGIATANNRDPIVVDAVAMGEGFILGREKHSAMGFITTLPSSKCRVLINGEISPYSDYLGAINVGCQPYIGERLYIQQISAGFIGYTDKFYSLILPSKTSFEEWVRLRARTPVAKRYTGFLEVSKVNIVARGCGEVVRVAGVEFLISSIAQVRVIFDRMARFSCGSWVELMFLDGGGGSGAV